MICMFDVMYHGISQNIIINISENIGLYNQQLLGVYLCYTNYMYTDYSNRKFYTEFPCNVKRKEVNCYLYNLLKLQFFQVFVK